MKYVNIEYVPGAGPNMVKKHAIITVDKADDLTIYRAIQGRQDIDAKTYRVLGIFDSLMEAASAPLRKLSCQSR